MKIKQVCELTGLTDRAIRYYIEEGLVTPAYTENYLGRKSFTFSEEDAQRLKDIMVLRKFGFSIEEIKLILTDPAAGRGIIDDLMRSKQKAISAEQRALDALKAVPYSTFSLPELADQLSVPVQKVKMPAENQKLDNWDRFMLFNEYAFYFLLALLPVGFFVWQWVWHAYYERYAGISGWGWLAMMVTLLPTFVMTGLGTRIRCKMKKLGRKLTAWLVIGCMLWQPVSYRCAQEIFGMSETTDFDHYMVLDVGCSLHNSAMLKLFPEYPGYGNRKYYYRRDDNMLMYDVYAEWTVDQEELQSEIARAEKLFASGWYGFHFDNGIQRVETENFTCLFSVDPMRETPLGEPSAPFRQMAKRHYCYVIFAWNEETGRVRYCVGDYFLGREPCEPYYLSLEW